MITNFAANVCQRQVTQTNIIVFHMSASLPPFLYFLILDLPKLIHTREAVQEIKYFAIQVKTALHIFLRANYKCGYKKTILYLKYQLFP